jgi:peptidoglycan/LPS O-acetylase OafA/YrhL
VAGSTDGSGTRPNDRIWFAQAIRGVACVIVVWEHLTQYYPALQEVISGLAFVAPLNGLPARPPAYFLTEWSSRVWLSPGQFAVGLFFLVSGFVIPFSLERRTIGGFMIRRFFRIYPTLWAGIAVTMGALILQAHLLGDPVPYGGRTVGSSAFLFGMYIGAPWVDPVYWSLAIEELFYIVAVLFAPRGRLQRVAPVLLIAVAMAAVALLVGNQPSPGPELPPFYFLRYGLARNATFVIFILIGVVFHQHYRRQRSSWASGAMGAALLGTFILCLFVSDPFTVPPNQARVLTASMLLALACFSVLYLLRDRVPYSRLVDRLADISYPLYIVHAVLGWILVHFLYRTFGHFYIVLLVTAALLVAVAALIHHFVEKPLNDLGRRIAAKPRFVRLPEGRDPPDAPANADETAEVRPSSGPGAHS